MTPENWQPVAGYEGSYEVSDQGRVRSLDRIAHHGKHWRGRMLRPASTSMGYGSVSLARDGKQRNNCLGNLRWGTHSDNQFDQVAHGTHANASKPSCMRGHPYNDENTYIRTGGRGRACRECARASRREYKRKARVRAKAQKEVVA